MTRIKLTRPMQYAIRAVFDRQSLPRSEPQDVLLMSMPVYEMSGPTRSALRNRGLMIEDEMGVFLRLSPLAFRIAEDLPGTMFNVGNWMKMPPFAWFEYHEHTWQGSDEVHNQWVAGPECQSMNAPFCT